MMKTTNQLSIYFFILALGLSSCSLFDSDAPTPVFVSIPSVSVSTETNQGDPQHKITDVWVNANGQELGVFPLPARIPVVIDDLESLELTVFAGIRNNGSNERPFVYTLMSAENFDIPLSAGETVTINPVFKYSQNAKFDFVEDFEIANIFGFKGLSNEEGGCLVRTTDEASTGSRSGMIQVTEDIPLVEVGTSFTFDGENNGGSDSYLEFDYKCDVPFFVGLYKTQNNVISPVYEVFIVEREDWNRIYIDFTLELAQPSVTEYRVMFLVSISESEITEGTLFLDNIKFVHF